ncbi:hypothetical protein B0I35DRAFT_438110 [Stachybotrys elegans]|uniref:LysM domain-containing protein n=1 Tax=Stachybotrys elegans TaxID=80388 RepID=A0A8K0WMU1_9HYPO|nr:hypothetical protein B0I35DRAFT_438110 [Stachybotrys elegans]
MAAVMRLASIVTITSLLGLSAAQYIVDPPTTAAPDTILDCTYWHVALANDTCDVIIEYPWLTLEEFYTYNPSLEEDCQFIVGNSYCVEQNWDVPPPTTTRTTSATTTTSPTPTSTPSTLAEWCASQAGGYVEYCPRCLYHCEGETTWVGQCFWNVFSTINRYDSLCWQHGGIDCANQAVDRVCPRS